MVRMVEAQNELESTLVEQVLVMARELELGTRLGTGQIRTGERFSPGSPTTLA
jgi:hypothetical protein